MNLKIIFLAALVLFASTTTIVAMSSHVSTPDKVWEAIDQNHLILDGSGPTPCREIDDDGGP